MTNEGFGSRLDGGSGNGKKYVDLWQFGCGLGDEREEHANDNSQILECNMECQQ